MRASRRAPALVIGAALLLLAGCNSAPASAPVQAPPTEIPRLEQPPGPQRLPARNARILAVGDLLMHTPLVYTSALPNGDFDFKPLFAPVQKWIAGADLAVANLETTLTGPKYPWSGYPSFNTPPELARDVQKVGFDVLTHANNHALDYDEYGLIQTSNALDRYGIPQTGTNRTPEERDKILVVDVAPTIRMAILAYTYGTNGIPLPHDYSVNMLDPERIASDVRRAKALPGVDLVAVALHMGIEYEHDPNDEQKKYVDLCLENGADIILGDHPHVIQRAEMRTLTDASGKQRKAAVIFSEGNFISNQVGLSQTAGLMLLIDIKKDRGVTTVERMNIVPTWVHTYKTKDGNRYRVVPVEQAMKDYEAKADPLITAEDYTTLKDVWADTQERALGDGVAIWHIDQPIAVH